MGEIVGFAANGRTGRGYLAEPAQPGPGIVVIQEWWGLVPHIHDVCDRFAAEGFVALAPDLYDGKTTKEPDEAGKLLMAMRKDEALTDLRGAVAHLRALATNGKVGATGFCMGGSLTLALAARGEVDAAVPFYGSPNAPSYDEIACPVLGQYAEHDDWPVEDVHALFERLAARGVDASVHIYSGTKHAFFNDTRPEVYDADAADLAWERTLAFLRKHLA